MKFIIKLFPKSPSKANLCVCALLKFSPGTFVTF
jgi:hypothetical protein